MVSPEGEVVKFTPKVPCEGSLENWLSACEKMMREMLKKELAITVSNIPRKDSMR